MKKRITFSTWEEQTEEYRKFSATTDFNTAMSTYLNKLLRFSFPDAFDEHGKPKPVVKKITFTEKINFTAEDSKILRIWKNWKKEINIKLINNGN